MAPVDSSPSCNMGSFELICSLKSNDIIPVHKYKSSKSGLTVFIAEVEGPVVAGYLCLATEAHDDDGLPHTLEHLIFLGSEKYPYKGILDLLANRCLASGTNAHTDFDNTFYTMETVGSDGFLTLLPVYLDHILYPTLKDSAFTTEVHHITGEGEDAGIVYCEMQGRENVGEYLVHNELRRAIYPGSCVYKSITGGALKNLRESTTNEKVIKYHKDFYRPENLCIIITGQVKHADVFKVLQPIEDKIIGKGNRGSFTRPWQSEIPQFISEVDKDILYPCNDEDNGLVYIGWRGPSAVSNRFDLLGCSLLLKYLTDTSASPLQKEFVEIEDPFASDVRFSLSENSETLLCLMFENVPKLKISKISSLLNKVLKRIADNENEVDLKRMNTVIHRFIFETLSNLESNPHDSVAYMIIGDFLFGNCKEDLNARLNEIESLKKLKLKSVAYWIEILKKYFIEAPSAVMKGIPSIKKQEELSDLEQKRVSQQIEILGPEGLKKKHEELQKSVLLNETPIPDEILTSVPIPSTLSINFHQIKNHTKDQHPKFSTKKLPFYTYLHHINTNFIYLFVTMNTSEVPLDKRPYIPLILEAILECPVLRGGKLIPYETVVAELEMDTIAVTTKLGMETTQRFSCGGYSHHAILALQLELAKYPKGVMWIKDLLYRSQLISDRLKIIASKIINDVAQMKRKGQKVVDDLMKNLVYTEESNHSNASMLRQQQFLTKMLERLNIESGQKEVLEEVEAVRNVLTVTKNINIYIAVNIDKLATQVPDLYEPWKEFSCNDDTMKMKLNVVADHQLIKPLSQIKLNGCVTGLGCTETSFLIQCSPGIKAYLDPDLPTLLVSLQYFSQLEGPMWRQIRGQGFAYSYDIYTKPNEGLLYLMFYKATNIIAAYKETKNIFDNHLAEDKWEPLLLESAKSSLICEIVQGEKSVGDVVVRSFLSYFKKVPHDYSRNMVKSISSVTIKDVQSIALKYIKPLFDPKICKTTIVCHPSKTNEVVKAFKELGHDLKLYSSLEETYLTSL